DYFSLSRDYIARKFREKTHIRLNDYINLVRVDEAKVQLAETNHLISDIAERVGFSNYRTFVRIFTNVTGISPKQYRNINKKNEGGNEV
ncbi:MAG: helix-turn-helix domain-containing protein, partial [Clostridia bacterium]